MQRSLALFLCGLAAIPLAAAEEFLTVPFQNKTGVSSLDWTGEATSEALREILVSAGVSVVERDQREETSQRLSGSANAYQTRASLLKLGEELECSYIIFGELKRPQAADKSGSSADNIQIILRIIDLDRFTALPPIQDEGSVADLNAMQQRIAWKLLRSLRPDAMPPPDGEERPTIKSEAQEHYVKGLISTNSSQKHRHFTQAVLLEPKFSEPCFQLGLMQWEERQYRSAAQWLEKVKPYDAHYFEANFLLGLCRYHIGDSNGAAQSFQMVARARPSSEVWNNLAIARLRRGDNTAWESLSKALTADPDDPDYQFNAAYLLWQQGDLRGAEERFRAVLKIDPGDVDAQLFLARCLNGSGPRRGDLSGQGLERLKENYQSAGIAQWSLAKASSE